MSTTHSDDAPLGFGTRTVHAGWEPDPLTGAVMPPVYLTSTYVQDAPAEPRNGYEYSRTQNPTRFALERALAELEGGVRGFAFASGMAAIHTLLLTLERDDLVVAGDDLYGGTHRLFGRIEARLGLRFHYVDTTDPAVLADLPADTRLLYLETPTNPLLKVTPLAAAIEGARRVGAEVAVDNTFASPALQNPIALGADVVVHSTTKYVAGHSDVVGGALVVADAERAESVAFHQNSAGAVAAPFDSFLTLRGLRTLEVRMQRHCDNARRLARFLDAHPKVERVVYPGLASHPQHEVAAAQMRDFGGMLCFEVVGGEAAARRVVAALRVFQLAESLGGVESLVELPGPMTHASVAPERRRELGIGDGLVRLSVGIEDGADLEADLARALQTA